MPETGSNVLKVRCARIGSGACAGIGAGSEKVEVEVEVADLDFGLRGLDFDGSGGGRIVYFVVMRVWALLDWIGTEKRGVKEMRKVYLRSRVVLGGGGSIG